MVAATVLFDGFARLVMTQVADVALDASGTWSFLEINALIQPFLDRKRKTYRIASHMLSHKHSQYLLNLLNCEPNSPNVYNTHTL